MSFDIKNYSRQPRIVFVILLLIGTVPCKSQDDLPLIEWEKAKDTLVLNKVFELYKSDKYSEARKLLGSLPKKSYSLQPGVLSFMGQCHYFEGNYNDAVTYLSMALGYSPESIGLYYYRAYSLMNLGKYKAAIADFAAYHIHYPDSKEIVLNLNYCLVEDGKVEQAIKLLEDFEPKDTTIYKELGYNYDEINESEKAIINFEKVLAQDSTEIESLEYLSLIYADLYNYERAFELIDQLLKYHENYGRAYYLKGTYYEDIGDVTNAQKYFDSALEKGYIWDD